MPETPFVVRVHTVIRDRTTPRGEFLFHSEQLFRALMEFALEQCSYQYKSVQTPTDNVFQGLELAQEVIGVSIMRSGECLEHALQDSIRGVKIGKILVQRDESTAEKSAQLFYSKVPDNITTSTVLLLDPMLASGSSARLCIQVLLQEGVKAENIIFVNLIAAPQGVEVLLKEFPGIKLVTTMLDRELDTNKYILPGIGDYGDLYFGTD
jgi:uracil phosphoribosyltransferase